MQPSAIQTNRICFNEQQLGIEVRYKIVLTLEGVLENWKVSTYANRRPGLWFT